MPSLYLEENKNKEIKFQCQRPNLMDEKALRDGTYYNIAAGAKMHSRKFPMKIPSASEPLRPEAAAHINFPFSFA